MQGTQTGTQPGQTTGTQFGDGQQGGTGGSGGSSQQALFGGQDTQIAGGEGEGGTIISTSLNPAAVPPTGVQQGGSGGGGTGGGGGSGSGGSGGGGTGGSGGGGGGGGGQGDGGSAGGGGGGNPPPVGPSPNPQPNPFASLFGNSPAYLAALLAAISRSGSGFGDDGNDGFQSFNFSTRSNLGSFDECPCPLTVKVDGGTGLLTITGLNEEKSNFRAAELLLVDTGDLSVAPHQGRAPRSTLVARGLKDQSQFQMPILTANNELAEQTIAPDFGGRTGVRVVDPGALTSQEYKITLEKVTGVGPDAIGTFEIVDSGSSVPRPLETNVRASQAPSEPNIVDTVRAELTVDGLAVGFTVRTPGKQLQFGQEFKVSKVSNQPTIVNGNVGINLDAGYNGQVAESVSNLPVIILPFNEPLEDQTGRRFRFGVDTRDLGTPAEGLLTDFSSRPDNKACNSCQFEPTVETGFNVVSFIDARIVARSVSDGTSPVDLLGGIVIADGTQLRVSNFIQRAAEFPAIPPPQPVPSATTAYFSAQGSADFDGSVAAIVANDNNPAFVRIHDRVLGVLEGSTIQPDGDIRTSLLSVLDSQLIGPETPTFTGETPNRTDINGNPEVSPLLEVVSSSVQSTSAVVVRATEQGIGRFPLDGALLEASAPILFIDKIGTMDATGHLIDLAGRGPNGQPC